MEDHLHRSRPDRESLLRHGVMRARNRNRDKRNTALHCQVERSFLEGQQLAIEGAFALYVDRHVEALPYNLLSGLNSLDAPIAIAAINRHKRPHTHRLSQNPVAEP